MKTAFMKDGKVTIRDTALRPVNADEIRIRVAACGICGTDLHDTPGHAGKEHAFGHEMAGVVLETGAHVTGLRVGQKVAIESASACGRCENCRNTRQELCSNIQSFFCLNLFGFAEETIVPAISAIPHEGLSPEVASLSEPLGVAIDLARLADIRVGSNVLIMGQGPIGLMALALAKRAGAARVFAVEFRNRAGRIRIAKQFGANDVIDPTETALEKRDFGCDIDRILVTSPPPTLSSAFEIAAKGAIISFIGIAYGDGAFCRFDANKFHFKKLQLRASFASPALCTPLALQYLREGVIDGEALISHRFPLMDMAEAMTVARGDLNAVKVIVNP